jgi:hypothetical protein
MKKRFFPWIILFPSSVCFMMEGHAQPGGDDTFFIFKKLTNVIDRIACHISASGWIIQL